MTCNKNSTIRSPGVFFQTKHVALSFAIDEPLCGIEILVCLISVKRIVTSHVAINCRGDLA